MSALRGRRVLITRQQDDAVEFARALESRGAVAVVLPTIEIAAVDDLAPLDAALERVDQYAWIVFASASAVRVVFDHAALLGLEIPGTAAVAAVGRATADALARRGVKVAFVPPAFDGATLGRTLPDVSGRRVLLPSPVEGMDDAAAGLRARGALVERLAVYETRLPAVDASAMAEVERGLDAAAFASPSAVRNFVRIMGSRAIALLKGVTVACIGPVTAEAARSVGLTVSLQPAEYTVPSLIDALEGFYARQPVAGPGSR